MLRRLIDADEVVLAIPVRVELLAGASTADRARLRRALSALPAVYPADETWARMERWIDTAGRANERFGFGDLLIGALAKDLDALVWSLDRDFVRMARLGLVDLYGPP